MNVFGFDQLGHIISRYPRRVLAAWLILWLIALPLASRVGQVLTAEPGNIPGSVAAEVNRVINEDFTNQGRESVVVAMRADDAEALQRQYGLLRERLLEHPNVSNVRDASNFRALPLSNDTGTEALALVEFNTTDRRDTREAAVAVKEAAEAAETADVDFYVAGGAATKLELEQIGQRDATRAELYGLPLSLIVLVVVFGAVMAAALPLINALTSIVMSFAVLFLLGYVLEFASFTQSIVTMLGMATGIDYALLIVNRFREELREGQTSADAAAITVATAGKAVAFSGFTSMVGLAALWVPPLGFIRSIGTGIILVLLVGILVAVTALPAMLTLLGTRVNAFSFSKKPPGTRSRAFWQRRAETVMRHPKAWAVGGTLVLLVISMPMLNMRVSETGAVGLSQNTDTYQAQQVLRDIGLTGALSPYQLLIDFGQRGFYHPSSVRDVSEISRQLEAREDIEAVFSATTAPGIPRLFLYQYYARQDVALESDIAPLARATVSDSGRYTLLQVYPRATLNIPAALALEADLAATARQIINEDEAGAFTVNLGGAIIREREWADALYASMPVAILLVYAATFVLLSLAFRSFVVPLKAMFLNTLTVTGAFGLITLIFQEGIGAQLVGLSSGLGFVDTSVPLFVFAIVFGLSMDYEVFLVSRIYENHERGMSDEDAVVSAMTTTGSVISSAATIMVVVFAVFIFSEVILIKTLGLGLAAAVLLDATLVRFTVLPAVMTLAGKWTWWLPSRLRKFAERVNIDVSHN